MSWGDVCVWRTGYEATGSSPSQCVRTAAKENCKETLLRIDMAWIPHSGSTQKHHTWTSAVYKTSWEYVNTWSLFFFYPELSLDDWASVSANYLTSHNAVCYFWCWIWFRITIQIARVIKMSNNFKERVCRLETYRSNVWKSAQCTSLTVGVGNWHFLLNFVYLLPVQLILFLQ